MTPDPANQPAGPDRPGLVVFDLDGVLADTRHRLHLVAGRPKDWDGFFAAATTDPPLAEGVAAVRDALRSGHDVAYLTGRPARCRADTEHWLREQGLPDSPIHMRRDGDHRPARLTKLELLRRLATTHDIVELVDDDAAVVQAVRAAGFAVRHATWMDDLGDAATAGARDLLTELQEDQGRT